LTILSDIFTIIKSLISRREIRMQTMKLTKFIGMVIIWAMLLQTAVAQRRPRIVSPEIKSDRTVAFRFYAPQSHQVLVSVEYLDIPNQRTNTKFVLPPPPYIYLF
jgi:hypothetical protein